MPAHQPLRTAQIAEVVLFLLSERSSYCSGAGFVANGGVLAGHYRH